MHSTCESLGSRQRLCLLLILGVGAALSGCVTKSTVTFNQMQSSMPLLTEDQGRVFLMSDNGNYSHIWIDGTKFGRLRWVENHFLYADLERGLHEIFARYGLWGGDDRVEIPVQGGDVYYVLITDFPPKLRLMILADVEGRRRLENAYYAGDLY